MKITTKIIEKNKVPLLGRGSIKFNLPVSANRSGLTEYLKSLPEGHVSFGIKSRGIRVSREVYDELNEIFREPIQEKKKLINEKEERLRLEFLARLARFKALLELVKKHFEADGVLVSKENERRIYFNNQTFFDKKSAFANQAEKMSFTEVISKFHYQGEL